MTDWKTVQDSRAEKPPEWDKESSHVLVYQRRNIEQVTVQDEEGEHAEWQYEQRSMTQMEYIGLQDAEIAQHRADLDFIAMETGVDLDD